MCLCVFGRKPKKSRKSSKNNKSTKIKLNDQPPSNPWDVLPEKESTGISKEQKQRQHIKLKKVVSYERVESYYREVDREKRQKNYYNELDIVILGNSRDKDDKYDDSSSSSSGSSQNSDYAYE